MSLVLLQDGAFLVNRGRRSNQKGVKNVPESIYEPEFCREGKEN